MKRRQASTGKSPAAWLAVSQGLEVTHSLIYSLCGILGNLTKTVLPTDSGGETGSNKGNQSLPRRPFWPRCSADVQAVGARLLLCVYSSYRRRSQRFSTQKGEEHSDVPVMPERGYQLLMALSSQRKLSYGESVSRRTMCRLGTVTR